MKERRTFIPQWRMRRIRWEESLCQAQAKRAGIIGYSLYHSNCSCGSKDCLEVPMLMKNGEIIGGCGGISIS